MAIPISGVESGSIADRLGIVPGIRLAAVNGHTIGDVLDYRFYMTDTRLTLSFLSPDGEAFEKKVKKEEYDDLGLLFDTYLMDKQRSCRNKCVFCFIDQMPGGLREPLYFKDDDSRMSFLFGNYITMTNLHQEDIDRIIKMHISPVNVSVHTTNPDLRVRMMCNPHAGEVLGWLPQLTDAGIKVNTQLVLCPGINDGPELERSLTDLAALAPNLQSTSLVPVGLTRYRDGLAPLRPFTREEARQVIATADRFGDRSLAQHGDRTFYVSDEFYLQAGLSLPGYSYYGEFHQLENGVGLVRLLEHEFDQALGLEESRPIKRRVTLATGKGAEPFLRQLAAKAMNLFPGLDAAVKGIENNFFGPLITVAGLVTGRDLLAQLAGQNLGEALLIPSVMLRHEADLFLDGMSLDALSQALSIPVLPVDNDGFALLDALLGAEG